MEDTTFTEEVTLGKKYTDTVHGYTGVATQETRYITGCNRVFLENLKDNDIEGIWFDVTQLKEVKVKQPKNGGPRDNSESHKIAAPSR